MADQKKRDAGTSTTPDQNAPARQARSDEEDRLRGDSPNVLPDAEADSCVVARRRDDKESDS